ncbi:SRPBCC family protein [Actinocorallia longicatena]|uniref:Activator of Hsp90 ATPase homologue 1/2-like C-terminal domain-containing protein n=1 Tax=Actinocorallia longicatena TaxID=111803 RepID=A0ABP6QCK6_9ACTN
MNPTGRLIVTERGRDLILTRAYKAPIEDVWDSVTEPERTARWFGPWEGEAAPGAVIRVRMLFEDGEPWVDMRIDACERPHRLALSMTGEAGEGDGGLELLLTEDGGVTELRFVHHLAPGAPVGEMGAGWEYYLDLLTAAREGTPQRPFTDYYPAMKPFYEALAAQ